VVQAAFSQPNGNEMWVILLEKAFAKFCGSYGALDGGHTVWAWQAMTGDNVLFFKLVPATKRWARMDVSYPTGVRTRGKREIGFKQTEEDYDEEKVPTSLSMMHLLLLLTTTGARPMIKSGKKKVFMSLTPL
jgi:hypothetical protein